MSEKNKHLDLIAKNTLTKMRRTISDSEVLSRRYWDKWHIKVNEIEDKLGSVLLHGGVYSKVKSLKNVYSSERATVLNVGPETGFEALLLSELFSRVIICDPDKENLDLLKQIIKKYKSNKHINVNFIDAGINNKKVITKEKSIYNSLRYSNIKGLPVFYKITSQKEIKDLEVKVDYIFIHKIITTISRSLTNNPVQIFASALVDLSKKLKEHGKISWTEPYFFFKDNGYSVPKVQKFIKFDNLHHIKTFRYKLPGTNEYYVQFIVEVK